ncbi:MAG: hypothetical protein IJS08_16290 [Victivallales bacterium]|nr:hypothetical protein [Victivallales bacterium]
MEQYYWVFFLCCTIVALAFGIVFSILKAKKAKERETEKAQLLLLMKQKREEREKREKEEFQKYLDSLPEEERMRVLEKRLEESKARFEASQKRLQAIEMQSRSKKAAEKEAAIRSDANTQKALMFMLGAQFNEMMNEHKHKEKTGHVPQYKGNSHISYDEIEDDKYW